MPRKVASYFYVVIVLVSSTVFGISPNPMYDLISDSYFKNWPWPIFQNHPSLVSDSGFSLKSASHNILNLRSPYSYTIAMIKGVPVKLDN